VPAVANFSGNVGSEQCSHFLAETYFWNGSDENRPLEPGQLSGLEPTESVTKPTLRLEGPLPAPNSPSRRMRRNRWSQSSECAIHSNPLRNP